jgi:hypothetical protein
VDAGVEGADGAGALGPGRGLLLQLGEQFVEGLHLKRQA